MKINKRVIAAALALLSLISTSSLTAMADTSIIDSTGSVVEDADAVNISDIKGKDVSQNKITEYQTINDNSTADTKVYLSKEETIEVVVPKVIILNDKGKGNYAVKVNGDIAGNSVINVSPQNNSETVYNQGDSFPTSQTSDAYFYMGSYKKKDVVAEVKQTKKEFLYDDIKDLEDDEYSTTSGSVDSSVSAGMWHGNFNFNISLNETGETTSQSGSTSKSLHNYSTEEQVVGTWVDGKTLYERTLIFDNLNDWTYASNDKLFEYDLRNDIPEIEKTLFAHCYENTNNMIYSRMFLVNSTPYNRSFVCGGNMLGISLGSAQSYDTFKKQSYTITVQYTKTTDSPTP